MRRIVGDEERSEKGGGDEERSKKGGEESFKENEEVSNHQMHDLVMP